MGVYVYAVKNKTIEADGLTVAMCSYAYKHYWGLGISDFEKKVGQMERRKERYGNLAAGKLNTKGVKCIATNGCDDKFKVGLRVYRYENGLNGMYYDDFNGEVVGYLAKQGRKWVIVNEDPLGEI